jgi:pyridoxamine--pyruvate transaminase
MAKKTTARSQKALKEPVITLSAGPVAAYPRILQAMSRPVQYDYEPWFQQYFEAFAK